MAWAVVGSPGAEVVDALSAVAVVGGGEDDSHMECLHMGLYFRTHLCQQIKR